MKKIIILALEQSISMSIVSLVEVLKMAGAIWDKSRGFEINPLFDIKVASIDGRPLQYSNYLQIIPDGSIEDFQDCDLIMVPSAGYDANAFFSYPPKLIQWIRDHEQNGALIAGGCTGVFVLAEAGILDGRNATTHWSFENLFRQKYPEVFLHPKKLITEDGNIYCSGGGAAGMDLCLYLIEKFCGQKTANRCAKILLLERGRYNQSPFAMFHAQKSHQDSEIIRAQKWIESCFYDSFQVDDVAEYVGMGLRNFKRRFKNATGDSPLVYIQKLRIEAAKHILENDGMGIEQVASQVGYEDVGFFRKLFGRYVGISPSAYRQKFNMQAA